MKKSIVSSDAISINKSVKTQNQRAILSSQSLQNAPGSTRFEGGEMATGMDNNDDNYVESGSSHRKKRSCNKYQNMVMTFGIFVLILACYYQLS